MTPQEALAQALDLCGIGVIDGHPASDWTAAILAALPEGWHLIHEADQEWSRRILQAARDGGAQQERERLRARVETYVTLALLAPRPGVVPSANEAKAHAASIFRLACLDVDADLADPEDDR